jgi:FAD/FMN-containing dehydrogenase
VEIMSAARFLDRFGAKVNGADDVGMAYGRLCVTPGEKTFLREAILTVFRKHPCGRGEEMPSLKATGLRTLRREVYRAQIGSAAGKAMRWQAEKHFGEQVSRRFVSRNQLLNEEAEVFKEQNAGRTDIIQEYFIPAEHFAAFLEQARVIIPRHQADLLNVTIRNVLEDRDAFLRYADRDLFGLVMLFNQARTPAGERDMEVLTQALIDAALACEGRYYLPYRLHATPAQLQHAYPQAATFFKRKRHYDPDGLFQNQFYLKYGTGE